MASDEERLIVSVEARIRDFERNMQRASQSAAKQFGAIEKRAKEAGDRMERSLRASTANIGGLMASLGVSVSFGALNQLAEAWDDISSRVNIAAGSQEQGAAVMARVGEIARRTYSDLGQTAEAYIANARALKDLGYATQTQLDYTESLNNALVISGAKGQRAESVMNALSKAMALGKLSGENLNTVISTGGRVAEALADGLGVTVSELRTLGEQGKLTGDVLVKALTGQMEKLREEAESMPATITDAMVLLRNSMIEYVGQLNEAHGVTSIFSDGIILAADNIGSIANAAAAAGAVLLSGYVPALARVATAQAAALATNPFLLLVTAISAATFALSAFGGEIQPVAGEMATLHDYAGAAWDTIRDGAASAGRAISDTLITAINFISQAINGAEVSFADLGDFVKSVLNQIIGEFSLVYDTIVIAFTKLPQAIADAVISAMNGLIEDVENGLNTVVDAVNATIASINGVGETVGIQLGTIGNVTLGRIENNYADVGEAAGAAYGQALRDAAQDHIGEALGAWRELANERAAARQAAAGAGAEIASGDTPIAPRPSSAGGRGGGSGQRGSSASGEDGFERQIAQTQARIAAIRAETEARRGLTGTLEENEAAMESFRLKQELLQAAQNAGVTVTPELKARIEGLAASYAEASQEAKALADSQEQARQNAQMIANMAGSLVSGFVNDLRQGKTAAEAFANAINRIADQLIDMAIQAMIVKPILAMFGFSGGGLVGGGGGKPLGPGLYAEGGPVRGPGGPKDDRIPAMLSNGEFVVNAAATAKHRALLEGINSGHMPAFAAGGPVGGDTGKTPAFRSAEMTRNAEGSAPQINISAPVTVNGSAGTPQQNQDLAERTAKQMERTMRGLVVDEIGRQMRVGNQGKSRALG